MSNIESLKSPQIVSHISAILTIPMETIFMKCRKRQACSTQWLFFELCSFTFRVYRNSLYTTMYIIDRNIVDHHLSVAIPQHCGLKRVLFCLISELLYD